MPQKKISQFFSVAQSRASNAADSTERGGPLKRGAEDSDNRDAKIRKIELQQKPLTFQSEQRSEVAVAKLKLLSQKFTVIASTGIGYTWLKVLEKEFEKPYFDQLSKFVEKERSQYTVYPSKSDVFSWTKYVELNQTKVVILGQDPYHGPNQAHGLAFSVPRETAAPPSLVNMYKELQDDIPGFSHPGHGNLSGWARQGVLLLNTCLTVRAHAANSHKDKGWETLTDAVIQNLSKQLPTLVFLLWGSHAQKKASLIDTKKHAVFRAPHPSPLSAHRGFFGCKHFSKANEALKKKGHQPIDWSSL
ncbi:unnamed protein product [Cyprideis torosa]|uniref:Uracil-DNA glycosylase n=1 Tax=Cyprideis torosa TaxID=163714 RepID=A0A7R8ZKJ2_9CRUS|nr:unnamed protein product [Cyprideis torosa]CAG0881820.1 unnamed protein product [Cyprideis torosa]